MVNRYDQDPRGTHPNETFNIPAEQHPVNLGTGEFGPPRDGSHEAIQQPDSVRQALAYRALEQPPTLEKTSNTKRNLGIALGTLVATGAAATGLFLGLGKNTGAQNAPAPQETGTSQIEEPSASETITTTPEVTEETVVYNDGGVERHGIYEYADAHQLVTRENGPEGRVFLAATNDDQVHQMLGTHFADFSSVINLRTDLPEQQDKEFAELAVNSTIFGEGAQGSDAANMLEEDRELNKEKPGSVTYKVEKIDHQAYQEGAIAGYAIFERTGPDGQSQKFLYNVALNRNSGAWKAEYVEVSAIQ